MCGAGYTRPFFISWFGGVMEKYIWGLDLSLSCTGVCIFSNDAKIIFLDSIDTKSGENHQKKLRIIADRMIELKGLFPPEKIIIEQGFYRFAASTQAIYKVHGVVQLIFSDVEQFFVASTSVKKLIAGKGNTKKDELRDVVSKMFPEITFKNNDESDALAIGLTWFVREGKL